MQQLLYIAYYKFLAYIKVSLRVPPSEILKNFGSGTVYLGFAVGAYFFSYNLIEFLLEKMRLGNFLVHEFMSIVFFIFFLSINVGNIIVSWSTMYKSEEVAYLFTKPIKPYKIFVIKFFDNLFYSSSTLLLILLSLFLGYVDYFNLNIKTFLFITLFNLFPFIIIAASLGVIILLLLVKLVSQVGTRRLIFGIVVLYLSVLVGFFKILSPMKLVYSVLAAYPFVDQYFEFLIPPIITLLPNQWFAESLYWILQGNSVKVIAYSSLLLSLSLLSMSAVTILGGRWYYKTWLLNLNFRKRNAVISKEFTTKIIDDLISWGNQTASIIKKDILIFIRDSTQVFHALILIFLILIFMMSVAGISYINFDDPQLAGLIYVTILLFNILLLSTFALRFIFPIVSLEGQSFWKLRTAPVTLRKIIDIKLLPALVLIVLLGQFLSFFSNVKLAPHLLGFSSIIFFPIALTIVLMNYGMGIIFVKYKEKNAIRIASSRGASLTFLFCLLYMLIIVLILLTPILEHFSLIFNSYYFSYLYMKKAAFIIWIISIMTASGFYIFSHRSINCDFN